MKTPISELPVEPGHNGVFEDEKSMSRPGMLVKHDDHGYFIDSCGDRWDHFVADKVQSNGFSWDGQNPEGPDWDGEVKVLYRDGSHEILDSVNDGDWTHRELEGNFFTDDIIRVFFIPSLEV